MSGVLSSLPVLLATSLESLKLEKAENMPGSADLNEERLLDDLVGLADDLREDLHVDFGVRAYRMFLVRRSWVQDIGIGEPTTTEIEFRPQPKIEPFHMNLMQSLEPCGLDEAGYVKVSELSLSYTQAEITGKAVVNEVEQDLSGAEEVFIRIREAYGQEQSYKDFKLISPPYPDRIKTLGWKLRLVRIEDS